MSDLTAWLTQIWDEREKACREAQEAIDAHADFASSGTLELRWMLQLMRNDTFQTGWTIPGPPTPAEDLARIAADRQILAHHTSMDGRCEVCIVDARVEYGGLVLKFHEGPCPTVRLLALPYADRPGYREEWRP